MPIGTLRTAISVRRTASPQRESRVNLYDGLLSHDRLLNLSFRTLVCIMKGTAYGLLFDVHLRRTVPRHWASVCLR